MAFEKKNDDNDLGVKRDVLKTNLKTNITLAITWTVQLVDISCFTYINPIIFL